MKNSSSSIYIYSSHITSQYSKNVALWNKIKQTNLIEQLISIYCITSNLKNASHNFVWRDDKYYQNACELLKTNSKQLFFLAIVWTDKGGGYEGWCDNIMLDALIIFN